MDKVKEIVPKHVAFIMDGNRRWARSKALPLMTGHARGYGRVEPTIEYARKKGIKYLTFWAFSTENWNRSEKEISYLMELFRKLFKEKYIERLAKDGVRIGVFGEIKPFPKDIRENIKKVIKSSYKNEKMFVNIALNYGGRDEIIRAVNSLIKAGKEKVTENEFSKRLYSVGQPDPDLIIRTSGEMRLSGFLSWQGAYSELYFTDKYWPDFDEKEFEKALLEYSRRQRRFGK